MRVPLFCGLFTFLISWQTLAGNQNDPYKVRIQTILVGYTGVGKSTLLNTLSQSPVRIQAPNTPLIGTDFVLRRFKYENEDYLTINYDSSGLAHFFNLSLDAIRKKDIVLVLYKTSDRESLRMANRWLTYIKQRIHDGTFASDLRIFLVANKDGENKRLVSIAEGEKVATSFGLSILHREVDAKDFATVRDLFRTIVEVAIQQAQDRQEEIQRRCTISANGPELATTSWSQFFSIFSSCY